MYPVSLDLSNTHIALAGNGSAAARRLEQVDEDNARHVTVFSDAPSPALAKLAGSRLRSRLPDREDIEAVQVVMVAGLDDERAEIIAKQARELGKLVNVEDKKTLCDFHFTSFVRRGDLLLTVSTNGKSPALSKRIREELEVRFGEEWEARLEEIGEKREQWKREGKSFKEVMERSHQYIEERSWLPSLRATGGGVAIQSQEHISWIASSKPKVSPRNDENGEPT